MTATASQETMRAAETGPYAAPPETHPSNPLVRDTDRDAPRHCVSPRTGLLIGGIVLATVALLAFAGSLLGLWGANQDEGLVFVIPAETNVARPGFDSAIAVPTDIRFKAGEPAVITVRNLDDETQRAGPFLVGPGQTYVQRFPEPGSYPIACSVNPLESVVVTVEA